MQGSGLFDNGTTSLTQKSINQNFFVLETKDPEDVISDAIDSSKATTMEDAESRDGLGQNKKKNKKKNKK